MNHKSNQMPVVGRIHRAADEIVFKTLVRRQRPYLDAWVHTPKPDQPSGHNKNRSAVIVRMSTSRGFYTVGRYSFDSPVKTGYRANDISYGLLIEPRAKRVRGTAVVLHGWMLNSELTLKIIGVYFAARGYRCFVPVLPFHLKRRVPGTFSGQLMVGTDTPLMRLAFEQATEEVLHLLLFARENYEGSLVLVGASLGGLIASRVICKTADLDRAYILVAGANLAKSVMEVDLFQNLREAFSKSSTDPEVARAHLSETDPVMLKPLLPPDKIRLHGGIYDPIFSPDSVQMLAEAWGITARLHKCGHSTIFMKARSIFRDLP